MKTVIAIEKIKDYFSGKYFDYITDREFNQKAPHYFGDVSDEIAARLYLLFSEMLPGNSANEYLHDPEKINESILHFDYEILSLYNTVDTLTALQGVISEPTSVLFRIPCNFRSKRGDVQVALIPPAENSVSGTIRLLELSANNEILSVQIIGTHYIKEELKKIKKKYRKNRKIQKLLKRQKSITETFSD